MSDEGFHEIQLNGKQLVFLFMAATVVSVVIFLFGVMVGRGVNAARGPADAALQAAAASATARTPADSEVATSAGDSNEQPQAPAAEPRPVDEMDYHGTLVDGEQPESLGPSKKAPARQAPPVPSRRDAAAQKTPPAERPQATDRQAPPPDKRAPSPRDPAQSEAPSAASGRYAVQLAALRERNEAEAIAKRLVNKGYSAYVLIPPPGAPPVYRVQVGRFNSRSDADRTAARLRKEERFNPWVTR